MLIATLLRKCDRYSAGERHVRLVEKQTLTGLCDGQQRRGTSRLQSKARTLEVQFVRDAGRQKVRARTEQQGITSHLIAAGELFDGAPLAAHIVEQIGVDARPGEYADGARIGRRIVAGVLQSLPRAFQKQAMLRVRQLGLFGIHAEEFGVELVDVLENGTGLHEVGGAADLRAETVLEFRIREARYRLDSSAKIPPELIHGLGPGPAARHADDGYRSLSVGHLVALAISHGAPRRRLVRARARAACWP